MLKLFHELWFMYNISNIVADHLHHVISEQTHW
jgi:hypothetical protein